MCDVKYIFKIMNKIKRNKYYGKIFRHETYDYSHSER